MFKRLLLIIVLILLMLVSGCNTTAEPPQVEPPEGREEEQRKPEDSEAEEDDSVEEVDANYITIKYRETPVNIAAPHFEYLNTDVSSFIRGAWYDKSNLYMVINLDGVYYHYCGMPVSVWQNFGRAESFGSFYHQHITGQYDCREGYVPAY